MRTKGWLDTLVLALAAQAPAHGYGIASTLQEAGVGKLAVASLYPVLKKLEADGELTSDWDTGAAGPARKVYSITPPGSQRLANDIAQWNEARNGIDSIFDAVPPTAANRM